MKSCCDEYCANHGCNQGRNCPVRIERVKQAKQQLDDDITTPWWVVVPVLAALLALIVDLHYLYK